MSSSISTVWGVIHGKTIVLDQESGLPDGVKVSVQLRPEEPPPEWLERLTVDRSVAPGKLLIKGTRLLVEDLASLVEEGRSDEDLRQLYPELTAEDIHAVHQYIHVPAGLRQSFGGWSDDPEGVDRFVEEMYQLRSLERPELEP